ncbi:MAG: DNA polymerase III subunit alpha [Bacteroidetes bacterium]|nr:DNA polymerase III subunit alpha [Bacteroidota bacterium]
MLFFSHSYYSLRYGTLSPEQLAAEAAARGIRSLALTDINNTTGVPDFIKACKEHNIKPIVGIEFRNGNTWVYTGIARNNEGLRELNEFLSECNIQGKAFPERAPVFHDAILVYPMTSPPPPAPPRIPACAGTWERGQGGEAVAIRPYDLPKLTYSKKNTDLSRAIIYHPVTFLNDDGYFLHRNLRAVDENILLSRLQPEYLAHPSEKMLQMDELLAFYKDFPQIVRNTERIAEACSIEFDFSSVKNKKTFTGSQYDDKILLEKLAMDGFDYRYGKKSKLALSRIRHELEIIDRLAFSSYFLITWDIIRYSMSRGFYHVGRGSGANSIVAYCLRITDVDPIELDLYFERFINPKRSSPPDFDIDYSWKERDEVLDYIFKRYGRRHTALLGAMSTFKGSSIFRELGKVYGLPKKEIDELVERPESEVNRNEITRTIRYIARQIIDFPNIRSIHAGGVLISEEPIFSYTALDMPPKGFQTTQWDMYVAEDIGFEKIDILSQRGIGHIRECAEVILENRGISVDVHKVQEFKKDEQVRKQLRVGESIGCFYIESPAMRGLLKKLRCENYLTLVAASSIIRPGVARSGMMREYIHRFHHPNDFTYLHPVMEAQLKETYGVMVYQEDVLKVCHHFAGLDLADADVLRRAMSGKYRAKKEFQRIVDKFFENCKNFGYPDATTREVWRQIESFAGYSFSKAHSASYAAESYQSLFLKAYYPLEFMVAVINNFGGFYKTWVYFNEARRCGANIELPCVNRSEYKTSIRGQDIFTGFIHIANLENKLATAIPEEQKRNGTFRDLEDFIRRLQPGLEQLVILIRCGAFRFTGIPKARLLWDAHMFGKNRSPAPEPHALFHEPSRPYTLPDLEKNLTADAYDEIELIGFPVTMTYFDLLETAFRGEIMAGEMTAAVGKKVRMLGHLAAIKYVKTIKGELMHFGTFLDVQGEFFDTVHFPNTLKAYPFRGNGIYLIYGEITQEFDFSSLTVEKMAKMPIRKDPRGM